MPSYGNARLAKYSKNRRMPTPTDKTFWKFLEAYPPPFCRLFGKEKGGGTADMAITDSMVALRSGLPIDRIRHIARQETWDDVPLGEMRKFLQACNFDPTNSLHRIRITKYEKSCKLRKVVPFRYLRQSPKWESEFLPLSLMVSRIMKSKTGLSPVEEASTIPAKN